MTLDGSDSGLAATEAAASEASNVLADAVGPDVAAPAVVVGAPNEDQHAKLMRWSDPRQTANIADELSDDELGRIGQRVDREYRIDVTSRDGWLKQSEDAMDLAMQVAKAKTYPWPSSSNIIYPLMTTAAIEFAARAYPAIVSGRSVVKGVVYGSDDGVPVIDPQTGQPAVQMTPQGPQPVFRIPPGARRARADRIGQHMSWQLLEEQPEWEEETDLLLHILPIVGCAFRKSYFDPTWARNMSLLVTAQNLVINYQAKSVDLAPRLSEELQLYPIEIEEAVRAETFIDQKYGAAPDSDAGDDDAPRQFIEQHRWLDLDGDGYPEPYIVTQHKDTAKVARIVARFDPEGVHFSQRDKRVVKIYPVQYYTKYDFLPNVDGGIYGMGFGQLLNPINAGINTTLNMLMDAGHRQVVGGGFIGRGLNMHGGSVRFKLGEYKPINATGAAIRDAIVHLETPGPSAVLFQLLGMLVSAGKEIAAVKDVLSGEATAQTMQPTTLLALIEQGLKVFTAIYKRIYRAEKREYDKLYRLNRVYLDDQAGYRVGDQWQQIRREDYTAGDGVEPISDPTMVSDMQMLGRANFLSAYQNDPLCNPLEIRRRIFTAAKIDNIDQILVKQMPAAKEDPAIELAKMQLANEGLKAASRARLDRVEEILKKAQAINQLAQADKATAGTLTEWITTQLAVAKHEMEMLDADGLADAAAIAAGPAGGPRDNGTGLPAMAPQPGNEVVPAVPA